MKSLFMLFSLCALALAGTTVRAEEKTFKVDNDGYIRNWLTIPAIELDDKASTHEEDSQKDFFNKEFFPKQKTATPAEGDKVKIGSKEVTWKAKQVDESIWNFDEQDNCMNIGVTYIVCESDLADVKLSIGSDDSSLWLLNGAEVIRVYAGRAVEVDQDQSKPVTLKKGKNVLYMATINGGGPTGCCARFVDKDGKAVKNIQISLTPPEKKE
jgi:hypothetical protein